MVDRKWCGEDARLRAFVAKLFISNVLLSLSLAWHVE